ncbi:S-adenosyl-L-methionine-dependent methyltransferase [Trametes sanguinea]|nr:S-adenosyl-L-methionine-dependent methyltransferase [Trametes sanguinea]
MSTSLSFNVMRPSSGLLSTWSLPIPALVSTASRRLLVLDVARAAVHHVLQSSVHTGHVDVVEHDGTLIRFGEADDASAGSKLRPRHGQIIIHDETFWLRVFVSYDIGFSEAYLNGEVESPDLKELFNASSIYIDNYQHFAASSTRIVHVLGSLKEMLTLRFGHSLSKAIENVAVYEASNELYQAFLSEDMMYSCPIWDDLEGGIRGDEEGKRRKGDLESAQRRKIEYILCKARLRPGDRVLEIGSGWGAMAIAAARTGCTVDTLTLSVEQCNLARQRVREAGLEDRVRVHLMDYRQMPPEFEKAFDACISVEMLEAVGDRWMPTYIKQIDWALKDDRATVVLTASTYPDGGRAALSSNNFARKYHWPNCVLPTATSLIIAFSDTLHGRFSLESVDNFGTHYPRCLREWGRRFEENWTPRLVQSLQDRHPSLKHERNLQIFKRRWQYMFLYGEVGFSRGWLSLNCWTFVRPVRALTNPSCDDY